MSIYATLNNVVDWIVGILVVFLIMFFLFSGFRNMIIYLIADISEGTNHKEELGKLKSLRLGNTAWNLRETDRRAAKRRVEKR